MIDKSTLIREIEALPPSIVNEVFDFIHFLKLKGNSGKIDDVTLASENALAKDWLLPVEDAAWADL